MVAVVLAVGASEGSNVAGWTFRQGVFCWRWTVRRGMATVVALASSVLIWAVCFGGTGEREGMTVEELLPFKATPYPPLEFQIGMPQFMQGGDFDGDGNIDLFILTASPGPDGTWPWKKRVVFLKGDGTGRFHSPRVLYEVEERLGEGEVVWRTLSGVTSGDFDLDGCRDFVVADSVNEGLQVFWGSRTGKFFTTSVKGPDGFMPSAVVSADLDGNGQLDLAALEPLDGQIHVFSRTEGERTFAHSVSARVPTDYFPLWMYAGVLADAAAASLVVLGYEKGSPRGGSVLCITIWSMSMGTLTLRNSTHVGEEAPPEPPNLAIGDYDEDGHGDVLVVRNQTVWILWAAGRGAFRPTPTYPVLDPVVVQFLLIDIDSDGCLNLVLVGMTTQRIWVSTGCYVGQQFIIPIESVRVPCCVVLEDLDGSGRLDLVVATSMWPDSTYLEIFWGSEVKANAEH